MSTYTVGVVSFEEESIANEVRVQTHAPKQVKNFIKEITSTLPLTLGEAGHNWHVCAVPSQEKRVVVYSVEDCDYHKGCLTIIGKSPSSEGSMHMPIPETAQKLLESIGRALVKI